MTGLRSQIDLRANPDDRVLHPSQSRQLASGRSWWKTEVLIFVAYFGPLIGMLLLPVAPSAALPACAVLWIGSATFAWFGLPRGNPHRLRLLLLGACVPIGLAYGTLKPWLGL